MADADPSRRKVVRTRERGERKTNKQTGTGEIPEKVHKNAHHTSIICWKSENRFEILKDDDHVID